MPDTALLVAKLLRMSASAYCFIIEGLHAYRYSDKRATDFKASSGDYGERSNHRRKQTVPIHGNPMRVIMVLKINKSSFFQRLLKLRRTLRAANCPRTSLSKAAHDSRLAYSFCNCTKSCKIHMNFCQKVSNNPVLPPWPVLES